MCLSGVFDGPKDPKKERRGILHQTPDEEAEAEILHLPLQRHRSLCCHLSSQKRGLFRPEYITNR